MVNPCDIKNTSHRRPHFQGWRKRRSLFTQTSQAEQTAFIYHPPTRVLAIQSNRYGVSPGNFAKYFELIDDTDLLIFLDPVLQANALERLHKITTVKNFNIRVAPLNNMRLFQAGDYSIKEIINLTKAFQAPSIDIRLTIGRRKNASLSIAYLTHFYEKKQ
ncbi:MAG: DUF6731 family protein [Crinalium sp.]